MREYENLNVCYYEKEARIEFISKGSGLKESRRSDGK